MNGEEKKGFPLALLAGAGVVLVGLAVLYFLAGRPAGPVPVEEPLPMGEAEQSYARRISFHEPQVTRATNFLGQEVTYLFVTVANEGDRSVREIEVHFNFYDLYQERITHDRQRLLGPRAAPLAPGERREIQVGWEDIPAGWNQHPPEMEIVGLLLD